ncbi:MAG: S8 family serine peptidase [Planctomycetota bacterium]|jgi:hypothetical protein
MVQSPKKMLVPGLVTCVVVLFAYTGAAAGAEGLSPDKILQPLGLNHAGVYLLRELEPSLTGSGVKYAVVCRSMTYIDGEPQDDYQPSLGHNCFEGKQFSFYDQAELGAGVSPHSTAICSILLGEDQNGFNPELGRLHYQGATPKAEADIYEFWHFLINNVFPGLPPDADIVTASIGSQSEYWWTRGIESLAEQYGLIVVAGIGNGLNVNDPLLYPGAGANVIGVGVVDSVSTENLATNLGHFALAYPEHSSFGPTADGRCKPDIVAPGNCLAADDNEPNRYEPTGNWSSFSTPVVAGAIGLLVQKANQDPDLNSAVSPTGGNCVIKAILMNSATKLPYWHKGRLEKDDDHHAPLDHIQGAGMLNALEAYRQLTAGMSEPGEVPATSWDNNLLDKKETAENAYKIIITEPAGKVITATAVWNKHYDSFYPFEAKPEKDVDLRLELWAVHPNNPSKDYLLDYSDSSVDNVEHIHCGADANYTNYEIVLSISDTAGPNQTGTTQQYGLAWNVSDTPDDNSIFWYDLKPDGIVNESDVAIFLGNWLSSLESPEHYLLGDINADGAIDVNDLDILLGYINPEADWRTE